jgi:hypothetical protein
MAKRRRTERFSGEITVAARIIDYLSSGLYPSPAACLKELVNNSYDADARHVQIFVKPDADRIIIQDDGCGMDKAEFETHFRRIAESHKREGNDTTPSGRPKIGKIGIGFIAANELCEVVELFSTKKGNSDLLHITIDFQEMRKPIEQRRRQGTDVVKADYEGEILEESRNAHYTKVFLKSMRGEAREILAGARRRSPDSPSRSLYGLTVDSLYGELQRRGLSSWKEFDTYSENMIHVALNVPIEYFERWVPARLAKPVRVFVDKAQELDFTVTYDGTPLRKPIILWPRDQRGFVSVFSHKGKHVSAKGYLYAQHGTIKPQDLHGLLIRIRHAAVGEYDPSFWDFPPTEGSLIQRWVSGEIWADDRLEDAMNIDRRTLREAHPAYVELRDAIHRQLRQVLRRARRKIYDSGNVERKAKKAAKLRADIQELARTEVADIAPRAARHLASSWERVDEDEELRTSILRRFSVVEFYRAVIEVAREVLTPIQMTKFLRRLTERLRQ